jgi:predicted XRE-type DNA-binding protein
MPQGTAAPRWKELGITQPHARALMKGAWRDFSADMLLVLASRVGLQPIT